MCSLHMASPNEEKAQAQAHVDPHPCTPSTFNNFNLVSCQRLIMILIVCFYYVLITCTCTCYSSVLLGAPASVAVALTVALVLTAEASCHAVPARATIVATLCGRRRSRRRRRGRRWRRRCWSGWCYRDGRPDVTYPDIGESRVVRSVLV